MRLVGSEYSDRGTIEVYHNGQWGTICDDFFDKADGDVICRMLGFDSSRYSKINFFSLKSSVYNGKAAVFVYIFKLYCISITVKKMTIQDRFARSTHFIYFFKRQV